MRLLLGSTAVTLLAASALYGGFELQTDDSLFGGWFRHKQISEWPNWAVDSAKSDSSDISRALQSAMCGGGRQEGGGTGGAATPPKEISEWPIWPEVSGKVERAAMCGGGQHEGVGAGRAAIPPKEISGWPTWPEAFGKVERAAMCGGGGQACGRVSGASGSMAQQQQPPAAGCGCCGQRGTLVVLERLTDWLVGPTASEDRGQQQCACGMNMAMMSQ